MSETAGKLAVRLSAATSGLGRGVREHRWPAVVAGIGLFVLLVVLVIRWAPQWLAQTDGLTGADIGEERGRVRTAFLAFVAGLVAVAGAVFTGLTFALSRRGQHIDRFTKAVDQLGNAAIDVRLGGIYALERLSKESPRYHGPVIDVLAAYIRVHGAPPDAGPEQGSVDGLVRELTRLVGRDQKAPAPETVRPAATDLQVAFAVLARRDVTLEEEPPRFDFRGLRLGGIRAERIHLHGADLSGAHLEGARFDGACLDGAIFVGAVLDRAQFSEADVSHASMAAAHLAGANLRTAKGLETLTLKGARYSRLADTFPAGFDIDAAGLEPITFDSDAAAKSGS